MELSDIRDWLRGLFPEAAHFFVGRIDASKEKCIGVYDGDALPAVRTIGPKTYDRISVSILICWTDNARETAAAARLLYDRLCAAEYPIIGGKTTALIALTNAAPLDCTRPDAPVYEQLIKAVFYYNL